MLPAHKWAARLRWLRVWRSSSAATGGLLWVPPSSRTSSFTRSLVCSPHSKKSFTHSMHRLCLSWRLDLAGGNLSVPCRTSAEGFALHAAAAVAVVAAWSIALETSACFHISLSLSLKPVRKFRWLQVRGTCLRPHFLPHVWQEISQPA